MRCSKARKLLLTDGRGEPDARATQHIAGCPACQAYAADWQYLRAGFQMIAMEPVVEPSWGFAARLVGRLGDAADSMGFPEALVAAVGRRFVYAGLVLTFLLSLVMLLPSSSPWKGPTSSEVYLAEPEVVAARTYPAFPGVAPENAVEFVPNGPESPGKK
jgi:hypothetical protein